MPREHIFASADIVKAVNRRLNSPQTVMLPEAADDALDAVIEKHVVDALVELGITDVDIALACKDAVTCALYIKLEDLLNALKKQKISLTNTRK